jgi:hypothetical protein
MSGLNERRPRRRPSGSRPLYDITRLSSRTAVDSTTSPVALRVSEGRMAEYTVRLNEFQAFDGCAMSRQRRTEDGRGEFVSAWSTAAEIRATWWGAPPANWSTGTHIGSMSARPPMHYANPTEAGSQGSFKQGHVNIARDRTQLLLGPPDRNVLRPRPRGQGTLIGNAHDAFASGPPAKEASWGPPGKSDLSKFCLQQ